MTTKDEVRSTLEALKMALEALEWHTQGKAYIPLKSQSAITAIREALAEPSEALAHAPEVREQPAISAGMTLRDCFAAKALPSILSPNPVTGQYALVTDFDDCAITAYKMADSMLKARAT